MKQTTICWLWLTLSFLGGALVAQPRALNTPQDQGVLVKSPHYNEVKSPQMLQKLRSADLSQFKVLKEASLETVSVSKKERLEKSGERSSSFFSLSAKEGPSEALPSVFLAGAINKSLEYSMLRYSLSSTGTLTPEIANCPWSGLGSVVSGYYASPLWGSWIGDTYVAFLGGYSSASGKLEKVFGYYSWNVITNQVVPIGSGDISSDWWQPAGAAYNYKDEKVYLVNYQIVGGKVAGHNLGYTSGKDTIITLLGPVTGIPSDVALVGLACNKNGSLFSIGTDGTLYKINLSTRVALAVGATGETTDQYTQSMAVDYRSQKLYWQGVSTKGGAPAIAFFEVDTANGAAIKKGVGVQASGLSSLYYTQKPIDQVRDLNLALDPTNPLKIKITFTIPSVDVNGEAFITENTPNKAEILKWDGSKWNVTKTITSGVSAGAKLSDEDIQTIEGSYTFGVRISNTDAKYTSAISVATITCISVTLPYANGFEDAETTAQKNVKIVGDVTSVTLLKEAAYAHTGTNSYRLSDDLGGKLVFQAFPVENGGVYQFSYYIKSPYPGGSGSWVYLEQNGKIVSNTYCNQANTYEKKTYSMVAEATGQVDIGLYTGYEGDTIYLDDVTFEETGSPKVPNVPLDFTVKAEASGKNEAVLSFTTPSVQMNDKPLTQLIGIIVSYGSKSTYPHGSLDTLLLTGIGQDVLETISVSKAGFYYFSLIAYNDQGNCPYAMGGAGTKTYVGKDKPKTPTVLKAEKAGDGKLKLLWSQIKEGVNGGYVADIKYRLISGHGNIKDTMPLQADTFYTFNTPLAFDHYKFTVEAVSVDQYSSAKSLYRTEGLRAEQIVLSEATSAGSTSTTYPLAMGTTTEAPKSSITQSIYQATGKAMYIDSLYLLTYATANDIKQNYKIYLGYADSTAFEHNKNWVQPSNLYKVFDGELSSNLSRVVTPIPLSGFYYEGTKPLLVYIVKPKNDKTVAGWSTYTSLTPQNAMWGTLYKSSPELNYDTAKDLREQTSLSADGYVPALIANAAKNLSTLKGKISNQIGAAIEGALLSIVSKEGNAQGIRAQVKSNASGEYSFEYMPLGDFVIKVQATGYLDSSSAVQVLSASSTVTLNVAMESASKIKISGKVVNAANTGLEGVSVKIKSLTETTTTTNNTGEFVFENMYGSTSYTLSLSKTGMTPVSAEYRVLLKDTVFAPITMNYIPADLAWVSAQINEEKKAVVAWNAPSTTKLTSWCAATDTLSRMLTTGGSAVSFAHCYTSADLQSKNLKGKKVIKFGFCPSDMTATYTIKICADTNTELYKETLSLHQLNMGKWNDMQLSQQVSIPADKELWLIVEVSKGFTGYPIGFGLSAAVASKGDLIYFNNEWMRASDASSMKGNLLIRMITEEDVQADAPNGYVVYRGKKGDMFNQYTKISTSNVKVHSFTDAAFAQLDPAIYQYAVCGDYFGETLSKPAYSGALAKDMFSLVNITVNANSGSAKGAEVMMVNKENPIYTYTALVGADGKVSFAQVWRGTYQVYATLPYHESFKDEYIISGNTEKTISLKELTGKPYIVGSSVNGMSATINYSANHPGNWFDDVESYTDFAIDNIGEWVMAQKQKKGGIQDVTWANFDKEQAFIVFNPSKTKPALPAAWASFSGQKYFMSFFAAKGANNDFLIRSVKEGGGTLSFYSYGVGYEGEPELFAVLYSKTDANPTSFVPIEGASSVEATEDWAYRSYEIPQDAKHIAINCISDQLFAFGVDDIGYQVTTNVKPKNFELYLDNAKVATVEGSKTAYTFDNLSAGKHILGVKSVFGSGVSEMVTDTIEISATPKPSNLQVQVEKGGVATLTYEAAIGSTPKSYKIFLGEDLKVENYTQTSYKFTGLKNGKYKASVVAVYDAGLSDPASVEFEVKGVGSEEQESWKQVGLYPNPSSTGLFTLVLNQDSKVDIFSASGQIILHKEKASQGYHSVDLSSYAKGVYYVRIGNVNGIKTLKAVRN